jgi:hypothetical protein
MKRLVAILALVLVLMAPAWAINKPQGPYVGLSQYSLWPTEYVLRADHDVTYTIHGLSPDGNIAADKSVTVKPTGGTYTTLAGAIAGELVANADLTAMAGILNIEIGGTWSSADTTAVVIDGFTTSAVYYVNIYTVSPARHAGIWSTSKYILAVSGGIGIDVEDNYVTIDGLQISVTDTANVYGIGGTGALSTGANRIVISNNIIKGPNTSSNGFYGIASQGTDCNYYVYNCVVYGFGTTNTRALLQNGTTTTMSLYSSTIISGDYCIRCLAGTITAKNVYAGGGTTEDWYGVGSGITCTTCMSSDAATRAGVTKSIALNTTNFTNVTYATADYHVPLGSALIGVGTDTSGDAAPMNFTTDIDGETRSGTWDIGADEYIAAGGAAMINNILIIIGEARLMIL